MGDDDDGLDGQFSGSFRRFPNSNLSSPLTIYPQRHVLNLYQGIPGTPTTTRFRYHIIHMEHIRVSVESLIGFSDDPSLLSCQLFERTRQIDSALTCQREIALMFDALRNCREELAVDLDNVQKFNPGISHLLNLIEWKDDQLREVSHMVANCFNVHRECCLIKSRMQQLSFSKNDGLHSPLPLVESIIYFNRDLMFAVMGPTKEICLLLNYEQFIMLADTVACRLMCMLSCAMNDLLLREPIPPLKLLLDVYEWGDDLLSNFGQTAYSVLGEYESFVTSAFVQYPGSDPLGLGYNYTASLYQSAHETEALYGISVYWTSRIINLLQSIRSPNHLSELFGIRKHWGNPLVDAVKSGENVQERLLEDLPINGSDLARLLASFNRMICLEYIRIHGCWPECGFAVVGEEYPLASAKRRAITRVPEHTIGHDHMHWALLKFSSNCVLDSYTDQLALLSDKSVSVYRSHARTVYHPSLSREVSRPSVPESRRLMLEFLRRKHFSVCDIFKIIMSKATPLDWLCNSAAMKGTEMKYLKARIFAVFTYELRQYFAATEDMLKEHLFKYNPHQTMTMSEPQLLARLRSITQQMDVNSRSEFMHLIHIVDFSKWNLRMKYTNTCLVFKSIDDFLGTPGLIESTHNLFWETLNVLQDPYNPPEGDLEEIVGPTVWRMHDCGWEGQRQKGWTLLTSALLSDLERLTGISSQICGQGDNQVLLSKFPIPARFRNAADWIAEERSEVRRIVDKFYNQLEIECVAIGLKVKSAETCRSLSYFNYGKRLYFDGIELSMTLKRISKIMTEPNDSFPTSEMRLKTMEGASYSANLYSHPGVIPYFISRITLFLELYGAFSNNTLIDSAGEIRVKQVGLKLDRHFLARLMRIPASLGGPPQLQFPAYLYRGHPDPLCLDVVLLIIRARLGCRTSRAIVHIVDSGKWFNTDRVEMDSLILAPYSLNIRRPVSAKLPLLNSIMGALQYSCRNPDIQGLFTSKTDEYEQVLLSTLGRLRPIQPAILNDIFGRTIPGRRQSFISSLRNTTSLGRLLTGSVGPPLASRTSLLERLQLEDWTHRVGQIVQALADNPVILIDEPHWVIAHRWREISWNCSIEGITVPHPLEQFKLVSAVNDLCSGHVEGLLTEHIIAIRHSEKLTGLPDLDCGKLQLTRSGAGNPYLGSTITEGIVQRDVECLNPSATWRDAVRLNMIRQWITRPGDPLNQFLIEVIRSRTDTPLNLLNSATGRPSRLSYNHRASLMASTRTCAPATTMNMFTRVYLSSNRMGDFSHGEVNYHMPFGPCFLNIQMLLALDGVGQALGKEWLQDSRDIFHSHVRYRTNPIVFDNDVMLVERVKCLPKVVTPKLLFANHTELQLVNTTKQSSHSLWIPPAKASSDDVRLCYGWQMIGDLLVQETIVRESLTVNIMTDYTHRENPITIGDVRMITVPKLIRVLSVGILLVAPIGLGEVYYKERMSASISAYLDTFSESFWSQLTPPFLNYGNLQNLQLLTPMISSFRVTRSSMGIIVLLKAAILGEIWSLILAIKYGFENDCIPKCWSICAPGMQSGKYLWSKYVELCCLIALPMVGEDDRNTVDFARDLSTEINASNPDNVLSTMWRVNEQFQNVICLNVNQRSTSILSIPFFSLYEPWIERLRTVERPELKPRIFRSVNLTRIKSSVVEQRTITFQKHGMFASAGECDCVKDNRSLAPHYECYFTPTGLLSKSHYRFMETISVRKLNVHSVISLGSSTGSEAAAISMLLTCKHVYVNCLLPITQFAPHTAGSYVPPAFLFDGHTNKLISGSNSAVTVNDLLLEGVMDTIAQHTRLTSPTGITCDVEMPTTEDPRVQRQLIIRLLQLTCMISTVEWLIVKVVVGCPHELDALTSVLGRCYAQVTIVVSAFSRAHTTQVFLCCEFVHTRLMPTDEDAGLVRLDNLVHRLWRSWLSPLRRLHYPLIFYKPQSVKLSLMRLGRPSTCSLPISCTTWIEGWGLGYTDPCSRQMMLNDLEVVRDGLIDHALRLIGTFSRVAQDYSLPRTNILIINDNYLEGQLTTIGTKYTRALLLIKLLDNEKCDLDIVEDACNRYMSNDHYLPLKQTKFKIRPNPTRFNAYYTRFLYEILGCVYNHCLNKINEEVQCRGIHEMRGTELLEGRDQLPYQFCLTNPHTIPDLRWSWIKRSKILTWLFLVNHPIRPITRYWLDDSHIHQQLAGCSELNSPSNQTIATPAQSELIWQSDLTRLLGWLRDGNHPAYICSGLSAFRELDQITLLTGLYALPWCGRVPFMVLYECNWGGTPLCRVGHPHTEQLCKFSWSLGKSLIGCKCYSCSFEVMIVRDAGIRHSLLDRLCSYGAIESVRDLEHSHNRW